jgi:hypothetical protein
VSELVATMLLLAMTIIAGFALFGFVRDQAGISELSYAQSVGGTNSYLAERFVVTLLSFTSTSVSVYLYTNGQIPTQVAQIEVYGPTRGALDVVYDAAHVTTTNPPSCAGQIAATSSYETPMLGAGTGTFDEQVNYAAAVTLTLPTCAALAFTPGDVYFVDVVGMNGNTAVYYQVM